MRPTKLTDDDDEDDDEEDEVDEEDEDDEELRLFPGRDRESQTPESCDDELGI